MEPYSYLQEIIDSIDNISKLDFVADIILPLFLAGIGAYVGACFAHKFSLQQMRVQHSESHEQLKLQIHLETRISFLLEMIKSLDRAYNDLQAESKNFTEYVLYEDKIDLISDKKYYDFRKKYEDSCASIKLYLTMIGYSLESQDFSMAQAAFIKSIDDDNKTRAYAITMATWELRGVKRPKVTHVDSEDYFDEMLESGQASFSESGQTVYRSMELSKEVINIVKECIIKLNEELNDIVNI